MLGAAGREHREVALCKSPLGIFVYRIQRIHQGGFAERYLAMLAAGGTKHYSELLKPFGLDAKDPKFWEGGLSVIAGMIDELEGMS